MIGRLLRFRSIEHAVWFGLSVVMYGAALCHTWSGLQDISWLMCAIHALFSYRALVELDYGRLEENGPYSRDCIWFNALMAVVHAVTAIGAAYL